MVHSVPGEIRKQVAGRKVGCVGMLQGKGQKKGGPGLEQGWGDIPLWA